MYTSEQMSLCIYQCIYIYIYIYIYISMFISIFIYLPIYLLVLILHLLISSMHFVWLGLIPKLWLLRSLTSSINYFFVHFLCDLHLDIIVQTHWMSSVAPLKRGEKPCQGSGKLTDCKTDYNFVLILSLCMQLWKQYAFPVITTMTLGIRCTVTHCWYQWTKKGSISLANTVI